MHLARASNQPLGTSGDLRRRLLLHHAPLALASAVVLVAFPRQRAGDHTGPMDHGGGRTGPMSHGGEHTEPSPDQTQHRSFRRPLTFATGYVALGLLALTLLVGPANLLLRKRNPISNYLSRDVGTWAAVGSVVHVVLGLQVHGNSFGLANWTGLAALVIVVGLLAVSSDASVSGQLPMLE